MIGRRPSEPGPTVEEIIGELRAFFTPVVGIDAPGPNDDYFALGLVNSLLALELVAHVERQFGIAVEVEDLDLDNFRTMNRTAAFIQAKRSASMQ
jgi:methoxymalonate biosynthesis acyl carrier protein